MCNYVKIIHFRIGSFELPIISFKFGSSCLLKSGPDNLQPSDELF